MKNGKYEVAETIHVFSCKDGHLKAGVGTQIIVNNGMAIAENSVRFPARLLESVRNYIKKVN